MIVVVDNHMTSSAKIRYHPAWSTTSEQDDCADGKAANMPYSFSHKKAIEPQFEAKSIAEDVFFGEAYGRGKRVHKGRTSRAMDWVDYAETRKNDPTLLTFEEMKELVSTNVAMTTTTSLTKISKDPEANPLDRHPRQDRRFTRAIGWYREDLKLKEDEVIHLSDLIFFWRPQRPTSREVPTSANVSTKARTHWLTATLQNSSSTARVVDQPYWCERTWYRKRRHGIFNQAKFIFQRKWHPGSFLELSR